MKSEGTVQSIQRRLTPEQVKLIESVWAELAALAALYSRRYTVPADDLLGATHDSLMKSVLSHDPAKGPFAPYARRCAEGAMLDEVARQRRSSLLASGAAILRREELGRLGQASTVDMESPLTTRAFAIERLRVRLAGITAALTLMETSRGGEEEVHAAMQLAKRQKVLRDVVERMSEVEQRAYRVLYVEGGTHADAANTLAISSKSIQRLNARILSRLAANLLSAAFSA